MKVKTKSGFECEVNERIVEDWRFTEAIAETMRDDDDSSKVRGVVSVMHLLLDKKAAKELSDHVMEEDGIIPTESISRELIDIVEAIGKKGKKS